MMDRKQYLASLDGPRFRYIQDHRVEGRAVFPAAGLIDAFAALSHGQEVNEPWFLENIEFESFVEYFETGTAIQFSVEVGVTTTLAAHSPAGNTQFARATLSIGSPGAEPAIQRPGDLRVLPPRAHYRRLATRGIEYGTGFQGVRALAVGDHYAEGEVELPAGCDSSGYCFHPALLDSCFQVALGLLSDSDDHGLYVPRSVRMAQLSSRVPDQLRVRARRCEGEVYSADIVITDDRGDSVAAFWGVELEQLRSGPAAGSVAGGWSYRPVASTLPVRDLSGTRSAAELYPIRLVSVDSAASRDAAVTIRRRLRENEWDVTAETAADGFEFTADDLVISVVVPSVGTAEFDDYCDKVTAVAELAVRAERASAQFAVVTIGSTEFDRGVAAALRALCVSANLELDIDRIRSIELESADPAVLDNLVSALTGWSQLPSRLVVDASGAEELGLTRHELIPRPLRLDPEGWYLVTGGLGAVGARSARMLVDFGARKVCLLSRTGVGGHPRRQELLDEFDTLGITVEIVECDAATPEFGELLRARIGAGWNLRGVIHAAGTGFDRRLADIERADIAAVAQAKIGGALALSEQLSGIEVDFVVLISSAAATWGSARLSHYAAANGFLDGIAASKRSRGERWTSLALGAWGSEGMADRAEFRQLALAGLLPMDPDRIVRAIHTVLTGDTANVTLADVEWTSFLPILEGKGTDSFFDSVRPHESVGGAAHLAQQVVECEPSSRQRLVAELLTEILGEAFACGADSVDLSKSPTDVGMDSFIALDVRKRISVGFGIELDLVALRELEIVGDLVPLILDKVGAANDS
ncbi:SDR family NAD(P)-dependent oxidoreductase [Nocardia asteroides]